MPTAASAVSISRSISFSPSGVRRRSSRSGRSLKASQGALFASIQSRYGVPPGPLLAIWGMETGFGSQRGNQNMLASIATLAYDCRRSAYFTEHLYAALQLIDRGALSPSQRGSMHGEVGQTQFMPKAILAYGTGNLENSANALTSTANFLKAHGWRAGAGYQPGEPNFAAIQAWNAAGVYQKAIALMGKPDRRRRRVGGNSPPRLRPAVVVSHGRRPCERREPIRRGRHVVEAGWLTTSL